MINFYFGFCAYVLKYKKHAFVTTLVYQAITTYFSGSKSTIVELFPPKTRLNARHLTGFIKGRFVYPLLAARFFWLPVFTADK
jgi:hypothetical protein